MSDKRYEIESFKPFSESLIWQLNRDYYQNKGLAAWRDGTVPHHLTSNSMVGKTYADLIFAFLKDCSTKGNTEQPVYLLELGAGPGRLAFHVLKHLSRLIEKADLSLPPFRYVLSDIVERNLTFYEAHYQFQTYFEKGIMDVAYFDAEKQDELTLRFSGETIGVGGLEQPLLVIANYFFDSIPNDLFYVSDKKIANCSIAIESSVDTTGMEAGAILQHLKAVYRKELVTTPFYQEDRLNELLNGYKELLIDAHLFFPYHGLQCIRYLQQLSTKGVLVLSMDKGFHEIHDLENAKEPDIVTHGSFSIWVNYHAYKLYCEQEGGQALFPKYSTFHLDLGCFFFLEDSATYTKTIAAYKRVVDDFGPDDFNTIKRHTYQNMKRMGLLDLIAILRLSAYDSILFKNILPRLKQLSKAVTFNQRNRLAETMHQTWEMYFSIQESEDLAYEIGGLFYDMSFFKEALVYFQHSVNLFGPQADVYYNQALCYYQLREDVLFVKKVKQAKAQFPDFEGFVHLDRLDLQSK